MRVKSSLKSLKNRDKNCQLIKRDGKILVINPKNKRFKAKQG
jgi:large subunit ribosomal protein L36